jgi:hypothetical protein
MLSLVFFYCFAECRYAECRYAACRGALTLFLNYFLSDRGPVSQDFYGRNYIHTAIS